MIKFFWWAAGANKAELEKYPTEYSKYAGMGATIVVTAIMAMFTGGYAISRIFENIYLTLFFALFWGALIFIFDRFIVSTIVKEESQPFWKEGFKYLPRIVIAMFLGIIIAMPLKLRIFAKEIEGEIVRYQKEYVRKEGAKIRENYTDRLNSLEKRKNELSADIIINKQELSDAYQRVNIAHYEMTCEAQGGVNCDGAVMSGSGNAGRGPVYREKKEKYERLLQEYQNIKQKNEENIQDINNDLQKVKTEIVSVENERENDVKGLNGDYAISNGILAEMEAFR